MQNAEFFFHKHSSNNMITSAWMATASEIFHLTPAQVEEKVLDLGILPARYKRNQCAISTSEQFTLYKSHVAIIGCGGLGCYVAEELARAGVGRITVIDPDVFEEHNLNRQLMSSLSELGAAKVTVAARRIAEINPAIHLLPIQSCLTIENGPELLQDVTVAVDALDSVSAKLMLASLCSSVGIPMVYAAIAGWFGQIACQLPGDDIVERIYQNIQVENGIEQKQGNLAFTAAVVGSLEAAEASKVILGKGRLLTGRMLVVDLLDMEVNEITV